MSSSRSGIGGVSLHRVNSSLSSAAAVAAAVAVAAVAGPGVEHMERALSPLMLDGADGAALRATTVYLGTATGRASVIRREAYTHCMRG